MSIHTIVFTTVSEQAAYNGLKICSFWFTVGQRKGLAHPTKVSETRHKTQPHNENVVHHSSCFFCKCQIGMTSPPFVLLLLTNDDRALPDVATAALGMRLYSTKRPLPRVK